MIEEITQKMLKKKHKGKAEEVFAEIALLGGFGQVGPAESQLSPDSTLDLRGVLDPKNKAVEDENKEKIKALVSGVKPEDADEPDEEPKPKTPALQAGTAQ